MEAAGLAGCRFFWTGGLSMGDGAEGVGWIARMGLAEVEEVEE